MTENSIRIHRQKNWEIASEDILSELQMETIFIQTFQTADEVEHGK